MRLSCTDRYVEQIASNKKDNFVANVGGLGLGDGLYKKI